MSMVDPHKNMTNVCVCVCTRFFFLFFDVLLMLSCESGWVTAAVHFLL